MKRRHKEAMLKHAIVVAAGVVALPLALFSCGSDRATSSAGGGGASSSSASGGGNEGGHQHPSGKCPETFKLPDAGYATVTLETDYEKWTTPIPMTMGADGGWKVTTEVPSGKDVQYKFVADGNWIYDPDAPTVELPSDQGTNVNNIAQAITCDGATPGKLELAGGKVKTTAHGYSFQVEFVPGSAELDTSKTVVTLNGSIVPASSAPYDSSTHRFTVSVSSGVTPPDKLGYVFQVVDQNGGAARLFVPFWIEPTSFEWKDAFMYEVMIDRFLPGGTSKAGPNGPPTEAPGDWKGGDFGGVTQKIEGGYFDDMGVNTLWLSSPILGTKLCEMGTGANTGHCLSGYHSYFPIASGWTYGSEKDPNFKVNGIDDPIDPHFGVGADLVALVNAAHRHGIRVLTDLVVNHVFSDLAPPSGQTAQIAPLSYAHGSDLAWFNIPYESGMNDCGNQNLWDTPTTATWNRADCWFDPYLPDLNSTNPSVDDALAEHAVWLMEQFDLDGFRVDAVKQVTNKLCSDMRSKIDASISTKLPFYMVGEALGGVVENVMDCVKPDMLNGSMDDPLHNTIVGTILQGDGNGGNDLDNGVLSDEATWTGVTKSALMGHFFGSHDTPRAISLAAGEDVGDPWNNPPPAQESNPVAFGRLQLAQAFLMTYDSIPVLWMGDEFGQPGAIDPDCRRMMRFDAALSGAEQSTLANFQKLGLARKAHAALRRGARTRLWVDASFYAYGRVEGSDIVVAAFNLGTTEQSRTMSVTNIGLTGTVTDALSGATATVAGGNLTLDLPPLTAAVFAR